MSFVLIVSAYTSIVTIILYLITYSHLYDWWKNKLGRVMNFSLISVGLIAIGVIVSNAGSPVGFWISITGWSIFTVLLFWRLVILLAFAKKRREDNYYSDN